MNRRLLGKTEIEISELAFGGAGIGLPYAGQSLPSEDAAIHLLRDALEQGINFFDTARMYGCSEERIGKAFEGLREEVVFNTKCVHFLHPDGSLPEDSVLEETIRGSMEESLVALRTDYVDVFMLHQATEAILKNETVARVFQTLKQEGKTRSIGASTYEPEESKTVAESGIWDVVQIPMNLLDQRHRMMLQDFEKAGVGVVVRSVLFRGLLTGRPVELPDALTAISRHIEAYRHGMSWGNMDLYSLAIRFVLSYSGVSAALIGMDRHEHLVQAMEGIAHLAMDPAIKKELEKRAFADPGLLNFNQWIKKGWIKN